MSNRLEEARARLTEAASREPDTSTTSSLRLSGDAIRAIEEAIEAARADARGALLGELEDHVREVEKAAWEATSGSGTGSESVKGVVVERRQSLSLPGSTEDELTEEDGREEVEMVE
ncbi:hypothetical protein HDU67_006159, partial [Dinochytrium kinnereticum]